MKDDKQNHSSETQAADEAGKTDEEDKGGALAVCERERDEYLNGWKRAKADLANYKKEEADRAAAVARFSQELLISDLLAVIRSFQVGLAAWREETAEKNGMSLIFAQFLDTLKRHGLEKISVETGGLFDPETQEAVETVETDKPPGRVAEEVETGYTLHGKVIKPAKVKIAK